MTDAGDAASTARTRALESLGLAAGERSDVPTLRSVAAIPGVGIYPLVALGLLSIVDTFQGYAFSVLTPEISRSLGITKATIASVIALKTVAAAVAPLLVASLVSNRLSRAATCIVTGVAWSLVAASTGFVTATIGLVAVLVLDGLSTGSAVALHSPLLMDTYPPGARVRILSAYGGFNAAGNVIAPLLVAVLVLWAGLTWRGVFVALGCLSLVAVVGAIRLRDPRVGRWDTDRVRAAVQGGADAAHVGDDESADSFRLGFVETCRRIWNVPTARRTLVGFAALGVLLIPYQTFLFFFLEERWALGPAQRAIFFAGMATVQAVALALYGPRAERAFRSEPGAVLRGASAVMIVGVSLVCLGALSPSFWLMVAAFTAASALFSTIAPAFAVAILSVVPAEARPHTSALSGIFLGGVGGSLGAIFLAGIERRFGVGGSMAAVMVPGVIGALIIASAGKFARRDMEQLVDRVVEQETLRRRRAAGDSIALLECRGIDYSYGPVQVLFDVDFSVEEGEMVALLGTNGAGKSTLLRVISGLGLPSSGAVRLRGADITFVSAERRVGLGVSQVPGGRAVFGALSVQDNLTAYGRTIRADRARAAEAIDRCISAFPRLGERRAQTAASLSGGEQQMLALSKALMLRPHVLLIDELSLGLAPVVVEQLLDTVREINAAGTAVVLVEQSVNVAMYLAGHAYFMEKGEVRFDGPTADLLARGDLLRAVFLDGAALAGSPSPNGARTTADTEST